MNRRPIVHISGPAHAGKTTFIERLLEAEITLATCIRAERDPKLRGERESEPRRHAELRRFREAGASAVALYRFPRPDVDAFYSTGFMSDYSEAVFIEGESPLDSVDLAVFIAPVPADGHTLLRGTKRLPADAQRVLLEQLIERIQNPREAAAILGPNIAGTLHELAEERPEILADLRSALRGRLGEVQPTRGRWVEQWTLEPGYEGIERAQLVIVNTRGGEDLPKAEAFLAELARLRSDRAVFADIVEFRATRIAITAVLADLSNRKDAGLRKAIARVKRALKRGAW